MRRAHGRRRAPAAPGWPGRGRRGAAAGAREARDTSQPIKPYTYKTRHLVYFEFDRDTDRTQHRSQTVMYI